MWMYYLPWPIFRFTATLNEWLWNLTGT
eukprot:UN08808